ncbi:MAG: von Willebrand factor type A domain protein [Firmicutes bacterium ADurb.Bin354]|nr:MAG: von Willebrand factor type A domain protein [Firmicutes bacterium ADurb.Bin354]
MEISLRNPSSAWATAAVVILAAVSILVFRIIRMRKSIKDKDKKHFRGYSTMWIASELPKYKRRLALYILLKIMGFVGLATSLLSSAYLIGRPSFNKKIDAGVKRRDIYLCLDVSYSLYELNADFVENLEDVVRGLEGDRVGISIFNTSTVEFMPLTTDMDFTIDKLEELKEYFVLQKKYMKMRDDNDFNGMTGEQFSAFLDSMTEDEYNEFMDMLDKLDVIDRPVTLDNEIKGSSLIGEGLASCLFNFPSLDDSERTRVIIMVSDNAQSENTPPTIELAEAADMCKDKDVAVFGIFPPKDALRELEAGQNFDNLSTDMRQNIRKTGGEFYVVGSDFDTEDVIKQIQSHEAMQVDEVTVNRLADDPNLAIMLCILGLILFVIAKGAGA